MIKTYNDETKKYYSKKIIEITEEELSKHKDFLKRELKKNFY